MENKRVSEIRFAGFTGDWEQRKLGDVSSVEMCRRIYKDQTMENGEIPFFKIGTFGGVPNSFISRELFEEYKKKFPYPEVGDVLISASGTIGKSVVYQGEDAYYQDSNIIWLKRNKEVLDNNFLNQFYQIVKWNGLEGSTIKRLYNSNILSTNINLPTISEQKKIGTFLNNIDNTIALHKQELETLKQTKQGFLQKMFPKEGKSVPEIRFPQFNSAWKECRFLEMVTIRRGLTYKPSDVSENGVRVLRSSNINEDTFELKSDDVFVKKSAINIEPVKENDILITSANGSSRLVGKHAIINNVNENMVHGGFMLLATSSQPYFINALMSSSWYDKFINVHVSGGNGAIGNLKQGDLESQIVSIPSEEEQSKIGQFFRQLDETINLHEQELETLKQTKKAFLQKMFV